MEKDLIRFNKCLEFLDLDEVVFVDRDDESAFSRYVRAHLSEIKEECEAYGYGFVYLPEMLKSFVDGLTEEQKRYYMPSGWDVEVGSDYLLGYCVELDKPKYVAALLRCNPPEFHAEITALKPLEEMAFETQLRSVLERMRAEDEEEAERQRELETGHIELCIEMPPCMEEPSEDEDRDEPIEFSIIPERSNRRKRSAHKIKSCLLALYTESEQEAKYDADRAFSDEARQLMDEVRERVEQLRLHGVDEEILLGLLGRQERLSRLVVTADYRIVLPDYDDMEIEMGALPKALFLLFLRHEEGIPFRLLVDYKEELREIYGRISDRTDGVADRSLEAICDQTNNAINVNCSRIRSAFVGRFDDRLARHYYITGERGEAKGITLPRELVEWEM